MLGYIRLMRPLNAVMGAIAVLIGGFLVLNPLGYPANLVINLLLAMVVAFLVLGAGNAINDYFDVESDRINSPKRPIPSGQISKNTALAFSAALFIIGIALSGFINWVAFIIALVNSFVLIIYSLGLQDKVLVGNIAISYLVGSTFLFGGAAVGNLTLPLLLMLLAGLANMAREVVKDLEDIEGDRLNFIKKLASGIKAKIADRFGLSRGHAKIRYDKKITIVAGICLLLAIFISPLPYLLNILGLSYLVILIPTDLAFLVALVMMTKASSSRHFHRISKLIKLGMFLGLIAFIVGVLF